MIHLPGTLSINVINGRNGPFNVGRLVTDLGEFTVKDQTIEEYDEGSYDGIFSVQSIYPSHYVARGRIVLEVRAKLSHIQLTDVDELSPDETDQFPTNDPLDDESPKPRSTALLDEPDAEDTTQPGPLPNDSDAPPADPMLALFGDLYAEIEAERAIKLDPTVDRSVFRRQRDALKELGYRFNPLGQNWTKAD